MLSGQKKKTVCLFVVCYIELSRVRKTQIPIQLDMHSGAYIADIDFGLAWPGLVCVGFGHQQKDIRT